MRGVLLRSFKFCKVSCAVYPRSILQFKANFFLNKSCRSLLTPTFLGLGKFTKNVKERKERFGKRADEFKVSFFERLDDKEVEPLTQEYLSYIYLMEKEDLPHLLTVVSRFDAQTADNVQHRIPVDGTNLAAYALRICHVLNDADTALQIYKIYTPDKKDAAVALATILDLLYEHKRYTECAEMSIKHLIGKHKLNRKQLQPLLTLAVLSTFNMKSVDGLGKFTQLVQEWKKVDAAHLPIANWLHISYCIEQGRINAAIHLLSENTATDRLSTVVVENLRTLAFIKSDQTFRAFNTIIDLEEGLKKLAKIEDPSNEKSNKEHKSAKRLNSINERIILFHDTYQSLVYIAQRENHKHLVARVRENLASVVHRRSLSAYLIHRITRHYVSESINQKKFPVFDELADKDFFSDNLEHFVTDEDDLSTTQVLSSTDSKPPTDEPPAEPERTVKPPTRKKMVLVNGYITFVDDSS